MPESKEHLIFQNIPISTTSSDDIKQGIFLISPSINFEQLKERIKTQDPLDINGFKSRKDQQQLQKWAHEFWNQFNNSLNLSTERQSWVNSALIELRRRLSRIRKRKRSNSLSSERYENPVQQHADIWGNKFPVFVEKIKDLSNTGTKLDSCFDFIKDARRFGRLPRIHIPTKLQHLFGRGDSTLKEADVIYLSCDLAIELLEESPHSLENKVIIIRDASISRKMDTLESFISYHKRWPDKKVDVQDFSQPLDAPHSAKSFPISEILADLADANLRLKPENPPRNLLNLVSRDPFSRLYLGNHYTILDQLLTEEKIHATDSIGRTAMSRHPAKDPDIHLLFEILAQAYSASGWHKDSSGVGTFLRCVFGVKLWPIIVHMTDAQRRQFKSNGENWRPEDQSVPVVCIFPDDIIFMQPGHDNVHGPITFETCYMKGGNCWDDRKLPEILAQIVDQFQSREISNEDLPEELREVINALWFRNSSNRITNNTTNYIKKSAKMPPWLPHTFEEEGISSRDTKMMDEDEDIIDESEEEDEDENDEDFGPPDKPSSLRVA